MKLLTLVLGLVAAGLICLGLVLGFRTVYDTNGYECGSAFRENPDLYSTRLADTMTGGTGESECDKERSNAQPLPFTLLGLGAIAGVASVAVAVSSRGRRSAPVAP